MKGESFDEMIERYKRDMMNITPKEKSVGEEKNRETVREEKEKVPYASNTQTGYLKVRVFAGKGKTVQGASVIVTVSSDESPVFKFFGFTGENGETQVISLPAPPQENSQAPKGKNVFASYDVRSAAPDFRTAVNRGVPIFEGITTVQDVMLLPQPGEDVITYEAQPKL